MNGSRSLLLRQQQEQRHHRIGVLVVLLLLFSAVFSALGPISPVEAAQRSCEAGFTLDQESGICVPNATRLVQQCPDGTQLNRQTGQCEEIQQQVPDCPDGTTLNPLSNQCVPNQRQVPDCPDGTELNRQTMECVPVEPQQPDCPQNSIFNPDTNQCEPIPGQQPDCPEGTTLDRSTGNCIPDQPQDGTDDGTGDGSGDGTADGSGDGSADDGTGDEPELGEPPVAPIGTVTLRKLGCPQVLDGESITLDALLDACTLPMSGVEFTIFDGGGEVGSDMTDISGEVEFTGLAPELHSIVESVPAGYGEPLVFCGVPAAGIPAESGQPQEVIDGTYINLTFAGTTSDFDCYWFNMPEPARQILVRKIYCDPGFVPPEDWDVAEAGADCGNPHEEVTFQLLEDGAIIDTQVTDEDGTLAFIVDDAGTYSLVEQIPDGFGTPYVYCLPFEKPFLVDTEPRLVASDADEDDGPQQIDGSDGAVLEVQDSDAEARPLVPAEDGEIPIDLEGENRFVICLVVNIPIPLDTQDDPDTGITIHKWQCPPGFSFDPETMGLDDLEEACATEQDGVPFTLADDGGVYDSGLTGEDGLGTLVFEEYNPGNVIITETIPAGYGTPVVFCTFQETLETTSSIVLEQMEVSTEGVFSTQLGEGFQVICDVFNMRPDDGGGIDIYKWLCPPDFVIDSTTSEADITANCTPQDGVSFHKSDGVGPIETKATGTDGPGRVSFPDFVPGANVLTETVPTGQTLNYVRCFLEGPNDDGPPPALEPEILMGDQVEVMIGEGYHLICHFFNSEDEGGIIIHKWICEEGFEITPDMTLEEVQMHCTESQDGVTITHTSGDGTSQSGETGDDGPGTVKFPDYTPGIQTLTETVPAGYVLGAVYCSLSVIGADGEPTTFPVEVMGNGISQEVLERHLLICHFFNVPDDHDIVIIKFICPPGFDGSTATYEELLEHCEQITIPIPFTITGASGSETQSTGEIIPSGVVFDGYGGGATITEDIPEGFGDPRVFCRFVPGPNDSLGPTSTTVSEVEVEGGSISAPELLVSAGSDVSYRWRCAWFNFQGEDDDNTVIVKKFDCPVIPEGAALEDSLESLSGWCTEVHVGVTFTLEDIAGSSSKDTDGSGMVQWDGVQNGPVTITETIPDGYGEPTVYCGWTAYMPGNPPAVIDAFPSKYDSPGGVVTTSIDYPGTTLYCFWFNWPDQPGDITINKWTCPENYDLYAWGANPKVDCTQKANGINYTLDGASGSSSQVTGDVMDSAVYWDGLEPGDYTVTEDVPPGTDYVFVLHCDGARFPGIQPYPLQFGNVLDVKLISGDHIVCDWYNVPESDDGWITLYKYWCTTKTYKSDVDCQIYENGIRFELWQYQYPGPNLVKIDEGITDATGRITWSGLPQGTYEVEEIGRDWCAIDYSKTGEDGSILVDDGEETVVKVYNCDPGDDKPDPKRPNPKQPTKYPNTGVNPEAFSLPSTGVGPMADSTGNTIIALLAGMALVLVVAGLAIGRQTSDPVPPAPETTGRRVSLRRRPAVLAASALAVVAPAWVAAQGNNPPPAGDDDDAGDGSDPVVAGTPTVPACRVDIPDGATPEADEECIRGEVPKHIAIEAIGVDADIEIQEIIDGALQDPTGPTLVTWYKETSRLGERGNGVYAGHLNYWGVPEGVFFAIKTLQAGDLIELTGQNDEVFRYAVVWVENQPGQEEPDAEVLGVTEEESITLITCGGEWDTTIAEYNERTTVRAVRQEEEVAAA